MTQRVKIANLTKAQLEKVRALEEDMGTWVVALEPKFRLVELPEEQMKRLQSAEKELDLVLLAYERT